MSQHPHAVRDWIFEKVCGWCLACDVVCDECDSINNIVCMEHDDDTNGDGAIDEGNFGK